MQDEDYDLLFDDEEEGPRKGITNSKATLKTRNQNMNSNSRPTNQKNNQVNEDSFQKAHQLLNDEDEFTKTTANMKEKFTTLQNFISSLSIHNNNMSGADKNLRTNNMKGLEKPNNADSRNSEDFYLDEEFEKEESTLKMSTIKAAPQKNLQSSVSHFIPKNQSNFTNQILNKSSNADINFKDPSQNSIHMKSNRTLNKSVEEDIDLLEKSAEFPVKTSQGSDRRRQLNSSFEKPLPPRGISQDNKQQPQRPTLAKPVQSTVRIVHAKQPIAGIRSTNKLEAEVSKDSSPKPINSERNTRATSLQRASTKTSQKALDTNEKSGEKQLKTISSQPKYKSSSPLEKRDPSNINENKLQYTVRPKVKKAPQKSVELPPKKLIGLMSATPYSDKVAAILNTDVRKRPEQVVLAQNTGLRHFIHELNEEHLKLTARSPASRKPNLIAEIQTNNQIISQQNEEIAQLTSRVNRIGSANHFLYLSEKVAEMKQEIKELRLEKKRLEGGFKKELYQGPARFYNEDYRKENEALEKEFLGHKMKFSRIKHEYELLQKQNSEAGAFLAEQQQHMKELQLRYSQLLKLAEHYNVKIKDDDSLLEDGKPKSVRKKELQYKLELLKNCMPVIEKNGLYQIESAQKESEELRVTNEKQSHILINLREKHKEIVTQIKDVIGNADLDRNTLLKLKRLLQQTVKGEEHGSVMRDDIVEHSLDFNNISSFFEGSNYTPTRLKQEISLEISNLAAKTERVREDANPMSDRSASPIKLQSKNGNSTSRLRMAERKPLVRLNNKARYNKSVERSIDAKRNVNTSLQEAPYMPTKPTLLMTKTSKTSMIEGKSLEINYSSAGVMDTEISELKARSISPMTANNRSHDTPNSKIEEQNENRPESKIEAKPEQKIEHQPEFYKPELKPEVYVTEKKFSEESPPAFANQGNQASTSNTKKGSNQMPETIEKNQEDNMRNSSEYNPLNYLKPTFAFRGRMKKPPNSEIVDRGSGAEDHSPNERTSINHAKPSFQYSLNNENENKFTLQPKEEEKPREPQVTQSKPLDLHLPEKKPSFFNDKPNTQQGEMIGKIVTKSSKEKLILDATKASTVNQQPLQFTHQGSSRVLSSISQIKAAESHSQHQPYLQALSSLPSNNSMSNNPILADKKGIEEQPKPLSKPNPFELLAQKPGRLNLTPPKSTLQFHQNDLGKPAETNSPITNKEIPTVGQFDRKPNQNDILFLSDSKDKPLEIKQGKKNEASIVDPFADVGDVHKINFEQKKGLFSQKSEFGQIGANQKDLIWLKNSNEISEIKPNEKAQFTWLGQEAHDKGANTDRLSRLSEERVNKDKYVPTISTDNTFNSGNNISFKKPRMKMNITPNEKKENLTSKAEKGDGNDFFADLDV